VIPFVDLKRRGARYEQAYLAAVQEVLRSGELLLGDQLASFEREAVTVFSPSQPDAQVIGVASGASALQLCLEAIGVGPGDEVIVPAFTAVPTASAVCATGARPVVVDVEADTAFIDPERAADATTSRTRAIIPVHLYGRPGTIDGLATPGVAIIEDAAQAHGAISRFTSTAVTYSFYPTKNVGGVGDGGAVVTADSDLAASVRRRRAHGMTERYVHVDISQNFRMSELEAAWLRLQLPDLAAGNQRRALIARHYREIAPELRWQADHPDHVFHLCVARFADRDATRAALASSGVATAVQYPLAINQQPAFRQFCFPGCLEAERWAAECVSIPCFPELTDAEVEVVADALRHVTP
jgi:aminotransferase EvaB